VGVLGTELVSRSRFAFLVKAGSQQIAGHVHEQAEVAGGVLAEGLQKRRDYRAS
jgi:hypothetical protein